MGDQDSIRVNFSTTMLHALFTDWVVRLCIKLFEVVIKLEVEWLGSPPFTSHFYDHLEGVPQPQELGTTTITMVINHLQELG